MDNRTREIRLVLSGMFTYVADSVLMATRNLLDTRLRGPFRAADKAGVHGLREIQKQYMIQGKIAPVQTRCVEAFLKMGPQVLLSSAPDTLAVLYCPALWNPSVITVESKENQLLVCCYTAKTIMAQINMKRALSKLSELLPDKLTETTVNMPPQCVEEQDKDEQQPKNQDGSDRENEKKKK